MFTERHPDAFILVINDDALTLELLHRMLEAEGYQNVCTETDAQRGLERCLQQQPDLLLLDLHMPQLSGYDVLATLRGEAREMPFFPVLVVTADTTPQARQRALALGASDFLTLPFDPTEALLRVRNLLALQFLTRSLREQIQTRTEQVASTQAAFEQLFVANPLPMWIYDRETLRFLAVNTAATGRYGFTREEFLQMTLVDIRPPAQVPDLFEQLKAFGRYMTSGTGVQARHRYKDGTCVDVWARFQPVEFEGRGAVVVTIEDITARLAAQYALQDSEQRYRLISENSPTMICRFLPTGQCVFVSSASLALMGYAPDEVLDMNIEDLIHPEDVDMLHAAAVRATSGDVATAPSPVEYRLRTREGRYIWVESILRAIYDEHGELLETQTSTIDISARKAAEAEVQEQLRRYRTLIELTAALEASSEPVAVVEAALERCLELTEYTRGYFVEVSDQIKVRATRGTDALPLLEAAKMFADLGELPQILQPVRAGAPFFPQDHPDLASRFQQRQVPTFCVLPLLAQGEHVAALVFVVDGPQVQISAETTSLLRAVAGRINHAFERSTYISQLNQSREETLRALGLVLEYRDYETKGHTDRVLAWSERLGAVFGFAGAELDALRWGAMLHDTGKVAIPDGILLKPGTLTAEEFEVIKRHPGIGHEMLTHIPSLPPTTLDVVLYHQERWNGSGYPSRRAGHDIPLAARLFAVVDVYDALTSQRPYKPAWTHEEAIAQLRREAGTLLDPDIVQVFVQLFSEGASGAAGPQAGGDLEGRPGSSAP
ncbi:HD domain-containing phosphohydrolase [Deinococcus navajonensis]|uniref:HD domain-containing phosphohydrolase n=1 Tax=Deinococcus navajonensis TaxID=309884 RepID=A0ABV8XR77_9DEIO